jgi:hypothetical protein
LRREQVVNNNYPSLGFFISIDSKKVKLVCFDTVLQVLIRCARITPGKEVSASGEGCILLISEHLFT